MAWKDILKLDFNAKEFYVGKYRKIENYGGPEEGGWWYNNFDHIESIGPLSKEKALEMLKLLNLENKNPPKEFWENLPEDDKDIARGFTISHGIAYLLENKKGDQQQMGRQYYE